MEEKDLKEKWKDLPEDVRLLAMLKMRAFGQVLVYKDKDDKYIVKSPQEVSGEFDN